MDKRKPNCYRLSFPQHLVDCEFNYHRLMRLMSGFLPQASSAYCKKEGAGANRQLEAAEGPPLEWSYVLGDYKQTESVVNICIDEIAKYTTTVHITIDSSLQNQLAWVKKTDAVQGLNGGAKGHCALTSLSSDDDRLVSNQYGYALDVRLYHDASLAEVVKSPGYGQLSPYYDYPNPSMHQRDEKTQLNQFLGELLDVCLAQGRVKQALIFTS